MISASEEVQYILTSDSRTIRPRAVIDLIDPDLAVGAITSSGELSYSRQDQLHDKILIANKYATTEFNRMALDGSFNAFPENAAAITNEVGVTLDELSGDDGTFTGTPYVQVAISGVGTLQTASVVFPGNYYDGYATDFTLEIYSGVTLAYAETVEDNEDFRVDFSGFTVFSPTLIKVIITAWSLPGRYPRITEILPGSFEDWDGSSIYQVDILQQADFSCMSLPYGTATLEIYNEGNRFDPRNRDGIFASLEDRQSVALYTAVVLPDGTFEYIPAGVFYITPEGWYQNRSGLTFVFQMTDIIGLLRDRKFALSGSPPATCEGWIAAIVAQLGPAFSDKYEVDESVASIAMTCAAGDLENVTCGDLLRWVCMYVGAYPRSCAYADCLVVEPVYADVVGGISGGELNEYPQQTANDDVSTVNFRLNDGTNTVYSRTGTRTSSSKTLSIANPFVTTTSLADTVTQNVIKYYGGQLFSMVGNGNPLLEIGDMVMLDLGANAFAAGRLQKQQIKILSDGTMRSLKSTVMQATGDTEKKIYAVLTEDGNWTVPAGVTAIDIVLVGGGDAGTDGEDATAGYSGNTAWSVSGAPGAGGAGGKIFVAKITVTPGAALSATIGAGGVAPGGAGGDTTFAGYSSADGESLGGYADFANGVVYGKDGLQGKLDIPTPIDGIAGTANTGNGGGGGSGGMSAIIASATRNVTYIVEPGKFGTGYYHGRKTYYSTKPVTATASVTESYIVGGPFPGGDGADGGSGAVVIGYEVPT